MSSITPDPKRVIIPASCGPLLKRVGQMASGLGMHAYAVGGCVRDWLFGVKRTIDLDVTVEGDGLEMAQRLARALGGVVEAHPQFGTATVILGRGRAIRRLDVATCRSETYAESGAYPRVRRGTLRQDLFRRDFTINAMAMAVAAQQFGRLIDPFGGLQDLTRRRLRILHPRSFQDDPSRILRGIRFLHRFGLSWDAATREAAERAVAEGALGRLNAGRLRKELARMGEEPDPGACYEDVANLLARVRARA